jgi:hypothetical protein
MTTTKKKSAGTPLITYSAVVAFTLVVCSFGVSGKIAGLTYRPEKLLFLAFMGAIPLLMALHRFRVQLSKAKILLVLWVAVSAFSSLLSVDPSTAIKSTLDIASSLSFFFIASSFISLEYFTFERPRPIIWVGVLLGICSVVVVFLYYNGMLENIPVLSEFIMVEKKIMRVKMMMLESNLFGAVMMLFSLLSISAFRKTRFISWFILLACHAGLLLAYSRGPLLGYFIGLIVYSHYLKYKNVKRVLILITFIILILSGKQLADIALGNTDENVFMRFSTLRPRILSMQLAYEDILASPFLGNGTYSIEFMHPKAMMLVGASEEEKTWIGIMPIAVLHDTGLIGFIILTSFFVLIFSRAKSNLNALKKIGEISFDQRNMVAWYAGSTGLLVMSCFTSAYSLAVFWVVMAIIEKVPSAAGKKLHRFDDCNSKIPLTTSPCIEMQLEQFR